MSLLLLQSLHILLSPQQFLSPLHTQRPICSSHHKICQHNLFIMQTRWCVIHIITMWKFSEEPVVLMVELLNRINLINYQCDVRWEMANATNRITHKVSDKSGLPSLPSLTSSLNLLNSQLVTLFIIFSHNKYWIHLCFHWKFRRIFSSYLHWHDMKVRW